MQFFFFSISMKRSTWCTNCMKNEKQALAWLLCKNWNWITQWNAKQTQESTQTNAAIFQTKRKFSKWPKTSNVIYAWSNKEKNQSKTKWSFNQSKHSKGSRKLSAINPRMRLTTINETWFPYRRLSAQRHLETLRP